MKLQHLLLLAPLAGCADGQLGAVALQTPCAAGDAACEQAPIRPLAVGAHTPLDVTLPAARDGQAIATHLEMVDANIATDAFGEILAIGEGVTAVLILADDDSVIDFTHISTAFAERLSLHRGFAPSIDERDLSERIQVGPGEQVLVTLFAQSDSQVLGGTLDDEWTITNDDFAMFVEPGRVRVVAPESGQATLRVEALGFSTTLDLEVLQ